MNRSVGWDEILSQVTFLPHPLRLFYFFFSSGFTDSSPVPFFVLGRMGWEHNTTIWVGLVPRPLDLELNPASQQALDSLTQ